MASHSPSIFPRTDGRGGGGGGKRITFENQIYFTELHHISPVMRKPAFAYAKTKTQISLAVTAKLISAFVFAYMQNLNFKSLAIFCGCTARFVSDLVENPEDRFSHLTTQLNYVFMGGGGGGGVICHILFYVIIMIGPLHDKTSNFCLQLIMHKSKFNVYPHELENDHIHNKAKQIST